MDVEREDRYSSVFLTMLSAGVCIMSFRIGIGTVQSPGSGFFPFWGGIILGLLSLVNFLIDTARSKPRVKKDNEQQERINWKDIFLTLASMLAYPFLLSTVGFLPSTFLFFASLLYFGGAKNWKVVVGLSAAEAVVTFFVFQYWLKIQFPVGILGI